MKSKKIPALITSLALILGLFGVIPMTASAADNNVKSEWELVNPDGGNFLIETPGSGYDSRVSVDGRRATDVVTKQAYDLTKTTFVMANLTIKDWANLIFAKTKSGCLTATNSDGGTLSLLMRTVGNNLSLTYWTGGGEPAFATVPKADKYEIDIVTVRGMKCLRINDTLINNDVANAFCANAESSYISFSTINRAIADVKFINDRAVDDAWVSHTGNSGAAASIHSIIKADAAGKTRMNVNSDLGVSSMAGYNMLENTLVLSNYNFNGNWFNITFSADRAISLNPDSDGNTFGFIINPGAQAWTANGNYNTGSHYTDGTYKIGFAKVGNTYRLYINDIYWTGDAITKFCESGAVKSCYVSSYAAGSLTADYSVVPNSSLNDWITTSGQMNHNVDGDTTDTRRFVWSGLSVATRGVQNMLRDKFVLKNTDVAKNSNQWNSVTFADKQASGFTATADGSLCLFLVPTVTDGVITEMRIVNFNNNWDWLGAVPAAEDYTFRFVKQADGSYKLEVNGVLFDRTVISSFCQNYAESCYITLSTANLFKATPEFVSPSWETVKQKEYGAPEYTFGADGSSCDAVIKRSSYVRETNRFDMRRTTLTFSNFSLPDDALTPNATDNPNNYGCSMAIVLAKNENVVESVVATSEQLTFAVRKLTDNKGISVHVVNAGGGWEYLGQVDNADSYTFNVVYSVGSGKYLIKINDTTLNENSVIDTFFAENTYNVYMLVGSHKTTVTVNLKATQSDRSLGDIDGDGERDIFDMVLAQREFEGIDAKTQYSDTDGNGVLEAKDVAAIKEIWFADGIDGYAYAQ